MADNLTESRLNADFSALQQLPHSAGVIVAVSGGSDSLSLLFLTRDYLQANRPDIRLLAVTVDHQLRAASALEAVEVAQLCAAHLISHRIVHWTGEKPQSGVAAAGREARYRLLMQAAKIHDAHLILTGHTADDQVETFLMRRKRLKPGAVCDNATVGMSRGLAGMSVQTRLHDRFILLRPLLSSWRQDLRDYLQALRIGWVDDPSNVNLAYERPRVRVAADLLDKPALLAKSHGYAVLRQADNQRLSNLLNSGSSHIRWQAGGCLQMSRQWLDSDQHAALLLLQYCVTIIGGKIFLPSQALLGRLQSLLRHEAVHGKQRITMHGCVIEQDAVTLSIWRESRHLPVRTLAAGQSCIWDQRYWINNQTDAELTIRCPSAPELAQFCRQFAVDKKQFHLHAALTSPAIFHDQQLLTLPLLQAGADPVIISPQDITWRQYYSCFDRILSGYDFMLADILKAGLTMASNHKCS